MMIDKQATDIKDKITNDLSALYWENSQISRFEITDIKPSEYPYFSKSVRSTMYTFCRRSKNVMDQLTEGENFMVSLIALEEYDKTYIETIKETLKGINSIVYLSVCFYQAESIYVGKFGIFLVVPVTVNR